MRATTAFKRLLRLDGVNVTSVVFGINLITVTVELRRRRLICPHCGYKTSARYDTRPGPSTWRHLDLGAWAVKVQTTLRRLSSPGGRPRRCRRPRGPPATCRQLTAGALPRI